MDDRWGAVALEDHGGKVIFGDKDIKFMNQYNDTLLKLTRADFEELIKVYNEKREVEYGK